MSNKPKKGLIVCDCSSTTTEIVMDEEMESANWIMQESICAHHCDNVVQLEVWERKFRCGMCKEYPQFITKETYKC